MQDATPLVSVIVPIYNVEDYLKECLDSIINQNYKHLEIILVNDGSTDSSGSIAQEYANKDSRICYFEQANKGQSAARNAGLDVAKGEFVYFMDSDDYIDKGYIEEMVLCSKPENIVINHNVLFEFADRSERFNTYKMLKGCLVLSASNITSFDFFVCNCLLPKSLIDLYCIGFIKGKICEDAGFLYQILPFAKNIISMEASAYHYRQRADSTTGKLASNHEVTFDRIDVFVFLVHWYRLHLLVERCGLPFHILYEIYPWHDNAQSFYQRAKEVIKELSIQKAVWNKDKLMSLFMQSSDALDFIYKRDMMQRTLKRRFSIRLFKKYNVVRLFGFTLYEKFTCNQRLSSKTLKEQE